MAEELQGPRNRLESIKNSISGAELEECCILGKEVVAFLAKEVPKSVPCEEVLQSTTELLKQILHRSATSLLEVPTPVVAGVKDLLLDCIQSGKDLVPKEEDRHPLTPAAEKSLHEVLESTLSTILVVCNALPKAGAEAQTPLIPCASEAHKAILAFAKTALETRSQLAPRLWKNIGEQLRCAAVQPELEPLLFDVPGIVSYLFGYNSSQLQNALEVWKQAGSEDQPDSEMRDKRLTAPIRHGLLTILRITASCPASVATQPCSIELAAFVILVTSLVSGPFSPLHANTRTVLTKAVAEAMLAVLTMLLESDSVSDASKTFLVRALCESDLVVGVAFYKACADNKDLGRLLPFGRLTSFCTLLSHSAKYSVSVKGELSRQLPQLWTLVQQSYPSLLSGTPCPYEQLLRSLVTFAVVSEASESSAARRGLELFLLEGVISSHPLQQQLAHDLWGVVFQLSEPPLQETHLRSLLTVLAGLVVSETALSLASEGSEVPSDRERQGVASAIASVARLVNQLLRGASSEQVEKVYKQYFGPVRKGLAETRLCAVLLRHEFPLGRLSGALQRDLIGGLFTGVLKAAEGQVRSFGGGGKLRTEELLLLSRLSIMEAIIKHSSFNSPALAHSAGQLVLRFFTGSGNRTPINDTANGTARNGSPALLYEPALRLLISAHQHIPPEQLWAVLPPLLSFFRSAAQSGMTVPPSLKPALAEFLATLSSVPMPESGPELQALVELYHVLLRESHWAMAHVALSSFSHFAATSPYTDLWRLVPTDAVAGQFEGNLAGDSLSDSGQELDGFMRALQTFLERSVGAKFLLLGVAEVAALEEDRMILERREGEKLVLRSPVAVDVDLNEDPDEGAIEEVQGNGVAIRGEIRHENGAMDIDSGAGVPEELQDVCEDMDRCLTAVRKELKRAASRLSEGDRSALRKKIGSLGQKLAGLLDQLCPD